MRFYKSIILIVCAIAMAACSTASKVNFTEANGYFFKNNQPIPTDVLVIQSKAQMEQYFGYATTMSTRPTDVDFQSQAVIAIVLGETDTATEVKISDIKLQDGNAVVTYKVVTGEKQSYTMLPMAMVVVDRAIVKGNVVAVKR